MKLNHKVLASALALFLAAPVYGDFDKGSEAFESGNYALAYQEFRSAAEQGDHRAQLMLGLSYQNAYGVEKDYNKALFWLEKAATQGLSQAQYYLAEQFYTGLGVEHDLKQAAQWYEQAAKQDHAGAQLKLGLIHKKYASFYDLSKSYYWFSKSAENGNHEAQLHLGRMYKGTFSISQNISIYDFNKSLTWFKKSAEQGNINAYFEIGSMYAQGQGVTRDYKQATYWIEKAAKQGHSGAQFSLASFYENGHGVLQDYIQAHKWMNIASANGYQEARRARDEIIAPKMTPQQIQQAQALARTFLNGEVAPEPKAPQPAVPSITTGSGFVISKGGQIVTNAHVVEGCKSISVELGNQQTSATLQAADNTNDMAILKSSLTTTRPANLAAGRITLGQTAYAMGYPLRGLLGQDLQMTNGIISGLNGLQNDFRYYQINAAVQSGNSGGPLLNEQANVIGIVSMKLNVAFVNELVGDLPQNVNFAIKSTQLMGYLDANSVDYQVTSSGQKLSSSQVAERAREFTVFITCEK